MIEALTADDLACSATLVRSPAGMLGVLIDSPPLEGPRPGGLAVVAHPQPLLGGSARHKIPHLLARGLADRGWLTLRPNFRGVGRSTGEHACGVGEADDLLALVHALRAGIGQGLPLALVGFSFGAHVVSRVAAALSEAGAPASSVVLAGLPDGRLSVWP